MGIVQLLFSIPELLFVFLAGCSGVQQSGGGARGDYVLVGRVGKVDGLHQDVWRGGHVPGATLPQAKVGSQIHFTGS